MCWCLSIIQSEQVKETADNEIVTPHYVNETDHGFSVISHSPFSQILRQYLKTGHGIVILNPCHSIIDAVLCVRYRLRREINNK